LCAGGCAASPQNCRNQSPYCPPSRNTERRNPLPTTSAPRSAARTSSAVAPTSAANCPAPAALPLSAAVAPCSRARPFPPCPARPLPPRPPPPPPPAPPPRPRAPGGRQVRPPPPARPPARPPAAPPRRVPQDPQDLPAAPGHLLDQPVVPAPLELPRPLVHV